MKRLLNAGNIHISRFACLFDTTWHIHRALDIKDTSSSGTTPTKMFGLLLRQLHMSDSLTQSLCTNMDGAVWGKWSLFTEKGEEMNTQNPRMVGKMGM